ncbi:MAG: hypothetical protein DI538_06735 [Azospira oryzae]|jgi:hypothetical protein|nr:MAG: hypothetical protein DI538_06735 [Azospira oryzae]
MSIKKIHVIGTVHSEGGACTTQELIKVIQTISPDIIFCEAPYQIFPAMLNAIDKFNTPEINALRSIIKNHSIDIVPMDLYDDPFDGRLEEMQELFRSKIAEYFYATEIHAGETYRLGFSYLNSKDSDRILQDKSSMEKMFVARAEKKN